MEVFDYMNTEEKPEQKKFSFYGFSRQNSLTKSVMYDRIIA